MQFGSFLRSHDFAHHNNELIRLNNGSFGACPHTVLEAQKKIKDSWMVNPDDFWHSLPQRYLESANSIATRLIGGYVGEKDIFVVDNLTVAIAIVTNNIIPKINKPNSAIIMSNFTYNAVKEAIKYGCELNPLPIRVIIVDIPFPILSDDPNDVILNSYKATLENLAKDGDISIALGFIDHIVSLPSMLIPVKEIIQLFRQYGVQEILVDGAHAPGQIQLDNIPSLGCDYYVANMHKWCFAPTSAAFLWCSPYAVSRHSLHHPVVSHSYGKGLWAECAMLGTRDYSAMLSIPAALDYLDHLGGLDCVVRRNSELRDMAVTMLSEAWNTTSFAQPASIRTPSLAMVGCPAIFGDTFEKSEEFRLTLRSKGIVVQKLFPVKGDRLYLRLSIAVYNTTQEFEVLRDTVLQIIAEKYGVDAILN